MKKEIELLTKLKVLAERGIGGEKENAKVMLSKLMKKYNLTIEDIETETLNKYHFKLPKDNIKRKLFWQILATIRMDVLYYQSRDKRNKNIEVKLTSAEYIEFNAKLELYMYHYDQDIKLFYLAFLQKNNIFAETSSDKEVTPEERAEWRKASLMSAGLNKHSYLKRIENGV